MSSRACIERGRLGMRPDFLVSHVDVLSPEWLAAEGASALLLDIDNTLLSREETHVGDRVRAWVDEMRSAGVALVLVSNSTKARAPRVAAELDLPLVDGAYKPLTGGIRRALDLLGRNAGECLLVGDQSYTDVLGAHRAGMRAVMVEPLCGTDPWHTRQLRRIDRWATAGMTVAAHR